MAQWLLKESLHSYHYFIWPPLCWFPWSTGRILGMQEVGWDRRLFALRNSQIPWDRSLMERDHYRTAYKENTIGTQEVRALTFFVLWWKDKQKCLLVWFPLTHTDGGSFNAAFPSRGTSEPCFSACSLSADNRVADTTGHYALLKTRVILKHSGCFRSMK